MIKRILSLIIDLIISLFPAYGAYLGGLAFIEAFIIFYFLSQVIEIITLKGQTIGMKLSKIKPQNIDGSDVKIKKLLFYHTLLTIDVITIFTSITAKISGLLIGVVLIFPFSFQSRCQSLLDLLFRIHWIEYSENKFKENSGR